MTTTSGGNVSVREENGDIWITPTRVDKGSLRREDIVCVRSDGSTEGRHPPSSELPFHQEIYRSRPDICGIVHAHPVALVAFSVVGQVPNTRIFHQARDVCGEVAFAPYQLPGSHALGRCVAETCGQTARAMPRDGLVANPTFCATRAVTIRGRTEDIWPWIAQMGYDRAGFYGYDLIENLGSMRGIRSAEQILPELKHPAVGDRAYMSRIAYLSFDSVAPNRYLIWTGDDSPPDSAFTWAIYIR